MVIERRAWQWVDWALFGIYTSWLGMGLLYVGTQPGLGGFASRLLTMLGVVVCYFAVLLVWHPGYTNKTLLPIVAFLTGGSLQMYLTYRNGEEMIGVVTVLLLILGFHSKGKILFVNAFVFLIALPIIEDRLLLDRSFDFTRILNHFLNMGSLFAIGYGIQRMFASNYGMKMLYEENLRQYRLIQEQNNGLEQYANQVEKLTLLEERNRMARELHDTVGHTFTSVIMGMDAVSYLMDIAPDKAKERLEVLRQVTRNGLEEVRRNIHQIAPQDNEGTFPQQMAGLANEFSVHTGTQVQLHSSGEECELPKQVQLTLIRCLQEALTNAKRHGRAQSVDIRLEFQQGQVLLQVEDDGVGSEQLEAGFGLSSMKERLGALQGRMDVKTVPGSGTILTCVIPIRR
jgi:signal transduction histidine kinase